ncbi:MAG: hypothetical protein L3K19_09265, partial [Thermoplasmata archaeon]|nr:hypothetical protein [Thermoplasmata archaeon]
VDRHPTAKEGRREAGDAMSRLTPVSATLLLLVFVLSSVGGLALSHPSPYSGLPAPTLRMGASSHLGTSAPSLHAAVASPRSASVHAAPPSASKPAAGCTTPITSPAWNSPDLFHDVSVTFGVPGSPQLNGSNFKVEPCTNVLPTYTNGFWMYLSTNVRITAATVQIWGYGWPTATNPSPVITGFDPAHPMSVPVHLDPPLYRTGSFYFNDYRYFWPGSQVYFNLTMQSVNATPSTIFSTNTYTYPVQYNGGVDNASWLFDVASPWGPAGYGNFTNNIQVTTIPTVLTQPAFDPNPVQPLQVIISGYNASGGPVPTIPFAQLQLTITGGQQGTGVYNESFGPANHTTMMLPNPLGPYPGTHIAFTITAWLPWEKGVVDKINSPTYEFNWTAKGGWWYPQQTLESNLQFTTLPNVLGVGAKTTLPTGTPVNVTIHEAIQNVTIQSAQLHFTYRDTSGSTDGSIPLALANLNTSYVTIPGLPDGASLTFSVIAKDIYGNPVGSGNTTYSEVGPVVTPVLNPGYGLFFFEAVDLATGSLVPSFNYTLNNGTWSETRTASPLGFAGPLPVGGPGYLPVAFGTYVITIHADGQTQTATFRLSSATPFTIVFYVASGPVPTTESVPQTTVTIIAGAGVIAAAIAFIPLSNWFRERRAKAEAEQRRVTL